MTDSQIIDLYLNRSEQAIKETSARYNNYCLTIAMNILQNLEDSEECVNDAYLKVWNAIPPARPEILSSFIGRIVRNLSLDRYKQKNAKKRSGDENALILSELELCIPVGNGVADLRSNVENEVDSAILTQEIERFLLAIKPNDRMFFVRRYWYNDSVIAIAKRFCVSQSKVMSSLFRTRNKLKATLQKEGII